MKKTLRLVSGLLTAVLLISLSSCSNEDDPDNDGLKGKDLYGTWVNFTTENEGQQNQYDQTFTYVFNEDGTGFRQICKVYESNLDVSEITNQEFTWVIGEGTILGQTPVVISVAGQNDITLPASILNGQLVLGTGETATTFSKSEKLKDLVGKWQLKTSSDVGTPEETVDTYTYEFKKNGTGTATAEYFYVATGVTQTQSYSFKYSVAPTKDGNVSILITFIDNTDPQEVDTYRISINGNELTMDDDVLTKVK